MTPEHPDPFIHWKHRRRGFYVGLAWGIAQTLLWVGVGTHSTNLLEALGPVIGWSYGLSATLIVVYYGGNAAEVLAESRR